MSSSDERPSAGIRSLGINSKVIAGGKVSLKNSGEKWLLTGLLEKEITQQN